MSVAPSRPEKKLKTIVRTGILPEWKERVIALSATHSHREVAAIIQEQGHPEVNYSTVRRFLLSVKQPLNPSTPERDPLNRIEPASPIAPAQRTPGYTSAMLDVEASQRKLDALYREAVLLAADSDFLIFETGPLEPKPDGSGMERARVISKGKPVRLSDGKIRALTGVVASRLRAIDVARGCIEAKAQIALLAARMEMMVKPKTDQDQLTDEEIDQISAIGTPEELAAIDRGDEAVFRELVARVRGSV